MTVLCRFDSYPHHKQNDNSMVPKIWTKAERASARLHIHITYRVGKLKVTSKPVRLRLGSMTAQENEFLENLILKYGTR